MGKEVIASRQNVFQLVPRDLIIRRSLQIAFRGQATTHTNARTVGKTIPASHNSRFHSIWALEMDTLPWGSKHKQAMAACNQATLKTYLCLRKVILSQNSVRDWVTVSVRQWRRVVYHISPCAGWHNPASWGRLCADNYWDRCVFYFPYKCIRVVIFHASIW